MMIRPVSLLSGSHGLGAPVSGPKPLRIQPVQRFGNGSDSTIPPALIPNASSAPVYTAGYQKLNEEILSQIDVWAKLYPSHRILTQAQESWLPASPGPNRLIRKNYKTFNVKEIQRLPEIPSFVNHIVMVGVGSSQNAINIAKPYIEKWTGRPVTSLNYDQYRQLEAIQGEYASKTTNPLTSKNTQFIFVSQSGRSEDIVQLAKELPASNTSYTPPFVVTNNPAPQAPENHLLNTFEKSYRLDRAGKPHVLEINAGDEQSIAATKTMTGTVIQLLKWAVIEGVRKGNLNVSQARDYETELSRVSFCLRELFEDNKEELKKLKDAAQCLKGTHDLVLISTGSGLSVLPEAKLKLMETSNNFVETFGSKEFLHGPKTILAEEPGMIYFVPYESEAHTQMLKLVPNKPKESGDIIRHITRNNEQRFKTDKMVILVNDHASKSKNTSITQAMEALVNNLAENTPTESSPVLIRLPLGKKPLTQSLLGIVVFQLLSNELAAAKGVDPNSKELVKVVGG